VYADRLAHARVSSRRGRSWGDAVDLDEVIVLRSEGGVIVEQIERALIFIAAEERALAMAKNPLSEPKPW
jgi:hypothetical protein